MPAVHQKLCIEGKNGSIILVSTVKIIIPISSSKEIEAQQDCALIRLTK